MVEKHPIVNVKLKYLCSGFSSFCLHITEVHLIYKIKGINLNLRKYEIADSRKQKKQ